MKKILFIIIVTLFSNANAREVHFGDLINYPKATFYYHRYTESPQPYIWKTDARGVDLLWKVNKDVNARIAYKAEPDGQDYWQTAEETNKLRSGDCEDYAWMKWHELLMNGVPEKDMWLLQGIESSTNSVMHAILKVHMDGAYYYLDNETDDITVNNVKLLGSYYLNRYGVTYYLPE